MFQVESVYNIVPQEVFKPQKEKLYVSQYPKDLEPTATTFGLLCSSYPGSANYGGDYTLPRGAHQTTAYSKTLGKPNGIINNDIKVLIKLNLKTLLRKDIVI